jgi:HK97 family phage prohead protease
MTQPLIRAYPAQLERSGPRQLTGRLVPYGVVADVVDFASDGTFEQYQEGFRRGAFKPQAYLKDKLAKIGLVHTHEGGLGYLGPFADLREEDDGLYGVVNILRSKQSDVEDLLESGVDELSVEFRLPKTGGTEVDASGVRWRIRAHLDQVALEPKGAYSQARVLQFRADADELAKEQAAAAEAAKAKAQAEAEEAQSQAEELKRAELIAQEAEGRRRRWAELTGRIDGEVERQRVLVNKLGVTKTEGYRH